MIAVVTPAAFGGERTTGALMDYPSPISGLYPIGGKTLQCYICAERNIEPSAVPTPAS